MVGIYASHLSRSRFFPARSLSIHFHLPFSQFPYLTDESVKTLAHFQFNSLKMPVKRSRVGSSTSHLETPLPAASTVSPAKVMRTDATAEPSRPKILAVASSVDIGQSNQLEIGGFLERCHYCKKRIAQNSEVFMYSNLCAFCSAECRDFQISLDQSAEQRPEKHKDKLVQGQGFYNVKGHSGV